MELPWSPSADEAERLEDPRTAYVADARIAPEPMLLPVPAFWAGVLPEPEVRPRVLMGMVCKFASVRVLSGWSATRAASAVTCVRRPRAGALPPAEGHLMT